MEMSCKVVQNLKDFYVSPFNEAIRSRMVCSNNSLFNVELSANVLKNLIFKFCPIITQQDARSRVWADTIKTMA